MRVSLCTHAALTLPSLHQKNQFVHFPPLKSWLAATLFYSGTTIRRLPISLARSAVHLHILMVGFSPLENVSHAQETAAAIIVTLKFSLKSEC